MNIISEASVSLVDIVKALAKGNTIVYPTETCYGIGCDATNAAAVNSIFLIKKRQLNKTVLVIMADIEMAIQYVEWNSSIQTIATRYWPGPVTVVAKKRDDVILPAGIISEDGTIAFRVSGYPLAVNMAKELGKPIVSTSANISSLASPYDVATIKNQFSSQEHQPDIIIDGGELPEQLPSTIVQVAEDGNIHILRQGGIIVSL